MILKKKIAATPFGFSSCKTFSALTTGRIDSYSHSRDLSSCFKSGKVLEAEKLFDQIPERNVVTWSILVHGYAINGFYRKCLGSFSRMRSLGFVPNSFTLVGVLVGVQNLRDPVLVQHVHGLILRHGLDPDPVVATALLDSYAKCGSLEDTCKVFDMMKNPGLVSCNAMISGYLQNELSEQGISLFNRLRRTGFSPNASTLMSVIKCCINLEMERLCKSIHGLVVKSGFDSELSVNNSVLDMYSSLTDLDGAITAFENMEQKDVICKTTMISLLIKLDYANAAINLFVRMRDGNVNLDAVMAVNLVSACTVLGDLRRGKQIHGQAIVCGFELETHLANSLMTMYSKCRDLDSSMDVFCRMSRQSLVSWTAVISGHLHNGQPKLALELFMELMLRKDYTLDSALITNVITASGDVAAFELCLQLHCLAFKVGSTSERSVQNSLTSAYSNCGNMDFSRSVFEEMGCLRNIISWNAIINGYGINGLGEAALALYDEMRTAGERPDSVTYLCLLRACSHSGLIKEGLSIFNELSGDENLKLENEHQGCVIDMLARAGCLTEAREFINEHLDTLNPENLRALLSGCGLHGDVELAETLVKRLSKQGIMESVDTVLLSNVYASVGRFQDAEALRLSMDQRGLRKKAGISTL